MPERNAPSAHNDQSAGQGRQQRSYHVIVFGATSFVGEILCRYLLERFGAEGELRWAMAGRSESKLRSLQARLGGDASRIPVLLADAADAQALQRLCLQTRVICTTVGPYALYGEPLLAACADTGTDYCDLTGEVQWIHRMIERYEDRAKATGARIVNCCGFDCIPSDLGVFYLQHLATQDGSAPCRRVKMRVKAAKGEFSGGTVASLMNVVKEMTHDAGLRKLLADPYAICPPNHGVTLPQPDVVKAEYDADAKSWIAPFVMAGVNTRVVHRTNALQAHRYGRDFLYDEALMTGDGFAGRMKAIGLTGAIAAFLGATLLPPTRWALERWVLPKPGEGPSPEVQRNGYYDVRFFGTRPDGSQVKMKLTGDRDPGYGSTAKMLGESAACLALDALAPDAAGGGFLTPATAMGDSLIKRLQQHAGIRFESY